MWLAGRGAVLALLLVLACALAASVIPRLLGYEILVVQGGSMGDSRPMGSLLVMETVARDRVRTGDVILVRPSQAPLPKIHRVISLEHIGGQTVIRTQGDANAAPDPDSYILPEQVAVPVATFPYLGFLVNFIANPLGWLLIIAVPAAILSFSLVRSIWKPNGPRLGEA